MTGISDLPAEIFQMVVHELVSTMGVHKAWKYRQVSKLFAGEIYAETFNKQPNTAFDGGWGSKLSSVKISAVLLARCKAPLSQDDFLPKKINEMVDFLVKHGDENDVTLREKYTKALCNTIPDPQAQIHGHWISRDTSLPSESRISTLLGIDSRRDESDRKECEQWYGFPNTGLPGRLAAATAVNNQPLAVKLINDLGMTNFLNSIFGNALAIGMLNGNSTITRLVILSLRGLSMLLGATYYALEQADFGVVKALIGRLQKQDLRLWTRDSYGQLVEKVVRTKQADILEPLMTIKYGGNRPNAILSAFKLACNLGNPAIIRTFVGKDRIHPDRVYRLESTLVRAIQTGISGVVKAVLDAGASADGPDSATTDCMSPLQAALVKPNTRIIQMLLDSGADLGPRKWVFRKVGSNDPKKPRKSDSRDVDPMAWALENRLEDVYELLRQEKIKRGSDDVLSFEAALELR